MRGGSWNNNQDNARSANRNRNNPNNRNDNIGFRVLCSSHIFLVPPGHGVCGRRAGGSGPVRTGAASGVVRRPRFAGRGEEGKMARVGPVRTARVAGPSGTYQTGAPAGLAPPAPCPSPGGSAVRTDPLSGTKRSRWSRERTYVRYADRSLSGTKRSLWSDSGPYLAGTNEGVGSAMRTDTIRGYSPTESARSSKSIGAHPQSAEYLPSRTKR